MEVAVGTVTSGVALKRGDTEVCLLLYTNVWLQEKCEGNRRNVPGHSKRSRTCLACRAEERNRYARAYLTMGDLEPARGNLNVCKFLRDLTNMKYER